MDIKDVQKLITEKKDNVLIPMVQSMSENFAKCFETGVEVGIEIGKAIGPDYSKIWHKPSEEPPIKGKEALVEYGDDYHDVGFYDEETKSFQIGIEEYIEINNVERWVYLEDLVAF